MSHIPQSSFQATLARPENTRAELQQILSNLARSQSGAFNHDEIAHFMTRANAVGCDELRILIYYAGHALRSRIGVLEKMLSHREQNDDQPPIAVCVDSDGAESWTCGVCLIQPLLTDGSVPVPFVGVFQKVAKHITSHHWRLHSWVCSACTRSYRSLDSLVRHKKKYHNSEGQLDAISAPSAQVEAVDTALSQSQSSVDAELPASTSGHMGHAVDRSSQERSHAHPPTYRNVHYTSASLVRDESPASAALFSSGPFPNPFVRTDTNPHHPCMDGIDPPMNSFPLHVTNAAQHSHGIGATGFPIAQDTHYQSSIKQWNIPGRYFDALDFSQPGSNSLSAPSTTYQAPKHSTGHYTPGDEMGRQSEMPMATSSFGSFDRQHFTGSTEDLSQDTFRRSDQRRWL